MSFMWLQWRLYKVSGFNSMPLSAAALEKSDSAKNESSYAKLIITIIITAL